MDDAAMLLIPPDQGLVVASDFIRGSGFYLFRLGLLDYYDIGYYLVVANLSDLAAMGATPLALTTIIRYGPTMEDSDFLNALGGIRAAADMYSVRVIGGDIGGYDVDVFAATALGSVHPEMVLPRGGARPGDVLCVTGTIGRAITALMYFKDVRQSGFDLRGEAEDRLLGSWKRPVARVREGKLLSSEHLATACQDVSDGLSATIEQMSSLSQQTFTVYQDWLPIDDATIQLARQLNVDFTHLAMSGSVDFELLFTVRRDDLDRCRTLFRQHNCSFSVIGEANEHRRNLFVRPDGGQTNLPGVPWVQQTFEEFLTNVTKASG